ncbi:MAG: TonB family protein [Polynucleobacter sp.]|jgi:protein TonB|nr:TonB family protein [Polynucleobacter sp.]
MQASLNFSQTEFSRFAIGRIGLTCSFWIKKHPLWLALFFSIVVHIIFLSQQWSAELDSRRLNTPLSIVLVNANSKAAPKKAQKLAQANLDGGGQTLAQDASAVHQARLGAEAKLEELEKKQRQMLAKLDSEKKLASGQRSGEEQKQVKQVNALEAELAKRLNAEGRLPRRTALTATSAKSVAFAYYYNSMRQKIEAYGSTFFPRLNGRPLYGSLVLTVSVDAEGRITHHASSGGQGREGIEISRSSGIAELDRQAIAIVRAAAPFGAFPPEMRQQLDVLDWVSTFEFTRDSVDLGVNRLELKSDTQKNR